MKDKKLKLKREARVHIRTSENIKKMALQSGLSYGEIFEIGVMHVAFDDFRDYIADKYEDDLNETTSEL